VGSNYEDSTGSDIGNKLNITRIEGGNAQGAGWGTYKE
jgi:xanthine dehydrogenase molybdopterin-binding subunit B